MIRLLQSLKALQGYGIMALELIQNADDAGASHLSFDIREDALVVRNSAEFTNCSQYGEVCSWETKGGPTGSFKSCNIHAISTMGARSKFESPDQIGRFGIGFVSVFQVTDTPIIRSGECEFVLNPVEPQIEPRIVPLRSDTEFELPWATSESPVRVAINASPTPPQIADIVLGELLNTIGSSILFLRHIEVVEIFRAGNLVEKVTIERRANSLTLRSSNSGDAKRWLLLKTSAQSIIEAERLLENYPQLQNHKRSREVTLALAIDEAPVDGKLFAYLPTQQSSRLPLHLNGDFYPESSRKDIVLRGKGQERQWNEALIMAAAELIGSSFEFLKEQLGAVGLWHLGKSCYEQRHDEIFSCYWMAFKGAAQRAHSVLSATGVWLQPKTVYFTDQAHDGRSSQMLSELGLPLISEQIRQFWNSLEATGVRRLTTDIIVGMISQRAPARDDSLRPFLMQIWHLIGQIVKEQGDTHRTKTVELLQSACFLLNTFDEPVTPAEVWYLPKGVEVDTVLKFLPKCPIVSSDAIAIAGIADLLKEYHLEAFAKDLCSSLKTVEMASEQIGVYGDSAIELYDLMLCFPSPVDSSNVTKLLKSVPFLRTKAGYVTPDRAQLPGGFEDPCGYLEFLDVSHFPPDMDTFARVTLGVRVLTFAEYLGTYLPKIIDQHGLELDSFRSIAEQIVQHRRELADDGVFHSLSDLRFIRTRANTFVAPCDCYSWNADAERVLGMEPENWLDEDWLPRGRAGIQFRDILESELQMPAQPTLAHMLRRIKRISSSGTVTNEAVAALEILVDRVCMYLSGANEDERRDIAALKGHAFLPAQRRGKRDDSRFYRPHEVYRAVRAAGFDSQAPIIDINALRRPGRQRSELMDLIEMPQVPPVALVVSHLRYCVSTGEKASPVTYDLLNEAVVNERDLESIKALADEPYILNTATEGYLKATEVFWSAPLMGRYWKSASQDMHRQVMLHEFLGVRDSPGPKDYARLMVEICGDPDPDPDYRALHERCVVGVCRALDAGEDEAMEALEIIADEASLISRGGNRRFPKDVLWIDRPYLVEPFGTDMDDVLVEPPQIDRTSLSRFYKHIGVDPLSSLAVQKLADQPDRLVDPTATELLRSRSDLLLWLAPNERARLALSMALEGLSVALSRDLKVQIELKVGAEPIASHPATALAYFEPGTLHVRGTAMNQGAWTAAFRQLFLSIAHHCPQTDIKPLAPAAVLVVRSDSEDEAIATLIASEFAPPPVSNWRDAKASALGNLEPDSEVEELAEEQESEGHDKAKSSSRIENPADFQSENRPAADDLPPHPREPRTLNVGNVQMSQDRASDQPSLAVTINTNTPHPPQADPATGRSGQRLAGPTVANNTDKNMPADNDYKSKVGGKPFGAEAGDISAAGHSLHPEGGGPTSLAGRQSRSKTSRMLAYVARSGDRKEESRDDFSDELSKEIDARSIERVMRYEADQGRTPVEQDHFNHGFDIISTEHDGTRRLIEVKGLRGQWNERGTKLTRTQYSMAQMHPDEFWFYVVEVALDQNAQQLFAIRNPFSKVDEYWFDSSWKGVAERVADSVELNARVGTKVHHEHWGSGHILEINRGGLQTSAVVDFGFQGKKFVPFTILKFVD